MPACEAWTGAEDDDGAIACGAPAVNRYRDRASGSAIWLCVAHSLIHQANQ